MSWSDRRVWGRDLKERGWVLPPVIAHLPLDLKRRGLYPRHREVLTRAIEQQLANPLAQVPTYLPEHLLYAAPYTQPNATNPVSYASSVVRAAQAGQALPNKLAAPTVTIDPKQRAAMRRNAVRLPSSVPAGRPPLISTTLPGNPMVSPAQLQAYGQAEVQRTRGLAQGRAQQQMRAVREAIHVATGVPNVTSLPITSFITRK